MNAAIVAAIVSAIALLLTILVYGVKISGQFYTMLERLNGLIEKTDELAGDYKADKAANVETRRTVDRHELRLADHERRIGVLEE